MYRIFSNAIVGASLFSGALSLATPVAPQEQVWQPKVGSSYQIILTNVLNITSGLTPLVDVYDIDLYYTPVSTIEAIHKAGKKVICYFSAGTSEDWRDDWDQFTAADKGSCLPEWSGERWLNVKSDNVFKIMQKRIALAAEKGCDAIDPDNMDGFASEFGNGISLTKRDTAVYLQKLAAEAAKYGMATGLKNAMDLIPLVSSSIQFAVNEQCAEFEGDCAAYQSFGKPVYHIEYVNSRKVDSSTLSKMCLRDNPSDARYFTTVVKTLNLDGWVTYCDGSSALSPTYTDRVDKGVHECKTNSP